MKRFLSSILLLASALVAPVLAQEPPSGGPAAPAAPPPPPPPATAVEARPPRQLSVVRVNVTNQPFDFSRPWSKRPPYTRRALGAVLPGGKVLVTGELVQNCNYVELEAAEGGRKVPAEVEAVDYEANLALLKTTEPGFLKPLKPMELATAKVGDSLAVLQLENNGNLLETKGTMTTAEVGRYPIEDIFFLLYRVSASLQQRDGSATVPVVREGKLVGMLARYDANASSMDLVPTPVIEHFLKDAAQAPYDGFPRVGMSFANTRDPQLRRYAGLEDKAEGGVYITTVQANSPSAKAGLEAGDVLLKIDEQTVDRDGNYQDPIYGKIAVSHLLSTRKNVGDAVKFTIFRKGESKQLTVKLGRRLPQDYVIDPYIVDRPPKFLVMGGFVFQELSRQFLREWGPDWIKKAPEDFVYMERQQAELYKEGGRKIVFLNRVLPTDATVGYENLQYLVVTKVNGREINGLTDLAAALETPAEGIHKVEFAQAPSVVFLDAEQVKTSNAILEKVYRLPALQQLD